jgi:hypothetical protein
LLALPSPSIWCGAHKERIHEPIAKAKWG